MPDSVTTTELILPALANHYCTLFAGAGLSLMTQAAYAAATRRARGPVVMAALREAVMTAPVPVGSLLELTATVTATRRSAMTVEVVAICERPALGSRIQAAKGFFEMVAVDDGGRPVRLPAPTTTEEAR